MLREHRPQAPNKQRPRVPAKPSLPREAFRSQEVWNPCAVKVLRLSRVRSRQVRFARFSRKTPTGLLWPRMGFWRSCPVLSQRFRAVRQFRRLPAWRRPHSPCPMPLLSLSLFQTVRRAWRTPGRSACCRGPRRNTPRRRSTHGSPQPSDWRSWSKGHRQSPPRKLRTAFQSRCRLPYKAWACTADISPLPQAMNQW